MSKILIVEDNANNREMLSRRLEKQGFEVRCAIDGKSGIALAKTWQPSIILMDIALGHEMDGWEATSFLKNDAATRAIPVIALTAHALATDRERSILAGCVDHEIKPIDFVRLLGKIREAIEANNWHAAGPAATTARPTKTLCGT